MYRQVHYWNRVGLLKGSQLNDLKRLKASCDPD